MVFDIFKKRGKKGVFSVEIVIAFIVSMLIVLLIIFAIVTQTKLTEGKAFQSYAYMRDEVIVGSDLFYIDAVDGRTGSLSNGTGLIRLSPTSSAMRLDKTLLKIVTMNSSKIYSYGGVGRANSKINSNGTATFGIEFVTSMPDVHNDNALNVGEVARIFFIFPSKVDEDTRVEFSIYPHNGRTDTKRIKVPEAIRAERIQLYP